MRQWDYYETDIATAPLDATARALADQMAFYAIGCVVIVDGERRPVAIVTDRDLACRVVARGADPDTTRAESIASRPLQVAQHDEPIEAVVAHMRKSGVRRMPVVRDTGLVGLVALDDLVVHLGRELEALGSTAKRAIDEGRKQGRRRLRRARIEEGIATLEASALASGREALALARREIDALRERLGRSDLD